MQINLACPKISIFKGEINSKSFASAVWAFLFVVAFFCVVFCLVFFSSYTSVSYLMEMFCIFSLLLPRAVIPCLPPPAIENGQLSSGNRDFTYGTAAIYRCNNGFDLIGNNTIHCTADDNLNGIWSGPAPECKGKCFLHGVQIS